MGVDLSVLSLGVSDVVGAARRHGQDALFLCLNGMRSAAVPGIRDYDLYSVRVIVHSDDGRIYRILFSADAPVTQLDAPAAIQCGSWSLLSDELQHDLVVGINTTYRELERRTRGLCTIVQPDLRGLPRLMMYR